MAGELATLNTALVNGAYTHGTYSSSYMSMTTQLETFNLDGLKVQFTDAANKYRDAATLLTQLRNAVQYLLNNGEWWNNVDIATLKQDIINAVIASQGATGNTLSSAVDVLGELVLGVSSDVRNALWPDFSSLESTIRQYSGASMPLITQALDSIKTTINEHSTLKAGETGLAISNLQNAILTATTTRFNTLDAALTTLSASIGVAVAKSEKVVTDALANSQEVISLAIAGVAKKTEDIMSSMLEETRKYFLGAGDDIALKVAEYLWSFAFEKVTP